VSSHGEALERQFFWLASQYYVAGRAAVFAGGAPVAGNLLHHAVEMLIKGALARHESTAQLRSYGHRLPKLWKSFRLRYPIPTLASHEPTVRALEKFEKIRYPDAYVASGMFFSTPVCRPGTPTRRNFAAGTSTPPTYSVVLAEVDELVRSVYEAASLNPDFDFHRFTPEGRGILAFHNASFPHA
jgi:hypothetical protein